jgi:hypothetical protein
MFRTILTLMLALPLTLATGCGDESPTALDATSGGAELAASPAAGVFARTGSVLRLVGDAPAYEGTVADIDGDGVDDPAVCFDLDILDATGRKIGTATDCLSDITPVGDGMKLVGTTIFRFDNGTFVTRGHTTVQPVTTDVPTPITHTTGAIPMDGDNGVIAGTGAYRNFRAQARLSGAVNLSNLDSEGRIAFDCLFAITPLR